MKKIFPLEGVVQNYAWGGKEFIPELLNFSVNEKLKYAEYWLGAHNKAPSILNLGEQKIFLNDFIAKNLEENLGQQVALRFKRLPFLFKVLDVHEMLSIQVHPTKEEAEKGFARENKLRIPLTAFDRNYKDDNHKPEIMVALSEFWLLHGFLSKEKIERVLNDVPAFAHLKIIFDNGGYYGLYKTVMTESGEKTNNVLRPLVERILPLYKKGQLSKESPDYWAAKAALQYGLDNLDKGIYSIYFFNIVKAAKGEAIFQDAGIPHAYLEGQNMELMANSDNVLRGGLTPKHVDVEELLKQISFKETIPSIIKGDVQFNDNEKKYSTPAPDFELSQIQLAPNEVYSYDSSSSEILMILDGEVCFIEGDVKVQRKKGESIYIMGNANYSIIATVSSQLYKATTPSLMLVK